MKTAKDVLKSIKDNDVKYVDLRFTDPRGKWQHVTFDVSMIDEDIFAEGTMFDGSSIAGWKAINESDMCLMPDPVTATIDPFFAETTMVITCDVLEPTTGEPYNRDPRGIAKKAEAMVKSMGVGDTVFVGPEAEFFVFDDVRFSSSPYNTGFRLDSSELPTNTDTEYEGGNLGHRVRTKGGYFPVPPQDSVQDMRSEMLGAMAKMGVKVEKHHHEVASAQHELGMKFDTLTLMADHLQIYKYCIHQVAHIYGKTATFMPKPVYGDNGSGMHVHQSIWKDGKPVFAGNKYADLSETCLHYIGGIIKHAKAINAFTNPSTNSYKRLVPGYEAPVLLAYSARNRSASCRIPYTASPKAKRVEVRFPDPLANPYLGFAAMLMAGLDGIKNKIDPGPAMDKDLYDLPKEELKQIPTVCGSLREALENLDKDRAFLKAGGVFDDDFNRQLHRAEDDRSRALRNDPAPGRVRHVLFGLSGPNCLRQAKGAPRGAPFRFGAPRRRSSHHVAVKARWSSAGPVTPLAISNWVRTRAFWGLRSSDTTKPFLSSSTSTLRVTKPDRTRVERTTRIPFFAAASSASSAGFDVLPSPTPASTMPLAPWEMASSIGTASMLACE
ncbi:glutamine synthetase [Bradyrhizobium japonicum]